MRRSLDMTEFQIPPAAAGGIQTTDEVSRREFMTVMGASLALAGASGCNLREPNEKLIPYVRKPQQVTPGKPLHYATACTVAGSAIGLLVQSHVGRPTKIEGNPLHPASLGATDAFSQASILTLYDPDRSKAVHYLGRIRGWGEAVADLQKELNRSGGLRETKGRGMRVLSAAINSPTLAARREEFLRAFPEARWHHYEPAVSGSGHAGTRLVFGEPLDAQYHFGEAKVVLTLDADPFGSEPGHLAYARQFAERRRKLTPAEMNRYYCVESAPTPAGMRADHRLPVRASRVETIARALASRLGVLNESVQLPEATDKWVAAVAADLRANGGQCVIVPGEFQPPAVHAIAHGINHQMGNVGKTLVFTQPVNADPVDPIESLGTLCDDMRDGNVQLLLILGGNPVFTAPADFRFRECLDKVPLRVHLGLYEDETSRLCHWHIPEAHYLETWGDTRAFDGTCTITQPLIAPLYGGRSALEVLAVFAEQPTQPPPYELVREHWRRYHEDQRVDEPFDRWWRRCIHDGVVAGTAFQPRDVTPRDIWREQLPKPELTGRADRYEIVFRPDPTIWDGRGANNAWLQELPKPLTKLTWDNAVLVSPATGKDLGLTNVPGWNGGPHGELIVETVNLSYTANGRDYRLADVPVMVLPGHPDGTVTLHFGYGRTAAGQVGNGTGFDVYPMRTSQAPFFVGGVMMSAAGGKRVLASVQNLFSAQSREAWERGTVRSATLTEFERDNRFAVHGHYHQNGPLPPVGGFDKPDHEAAGAPGLPDSLYPPVKYDGYKWGMVIDLNACVGCGGCVVACQAENSVPVVGKTEVTRGRIMHWLRIDEFFREDPARPDSASAVFQPLMCVQCENAPCEVVCPVEATTHSPDGLNEMTYNRCLGTRYCSNNCPYKVRRFNFLKYQDWATESLKLQRNPEVTVRSRGVMEKCTFCVQRIRNAEIAAKNQNRFGQDPNRPGIAFIRDGEVETACQAACPTRAITFGDMNDLDDQKQPRSRVAKLKGEPRDYGLLSDLNTRPRLTYLAEVRNPNPALEPEAGGHG